jgi:hypothetical protein
MSLPAAAASLAVLVLAWDETTPAARVLVEALEAAAPAVASVAVLVPAGPATAELTTEEYLPLASSLELLAPGLPKPPAIEAPATEASQPAAEDAASATQASFTEQGSREGEAAAASSEPVALATEAAEATPAPASAAEAADPNPPAITEPTAPTLPVATAAALVKPALVWQQVRVLHFTHATLAEPTLVWEGVPAAPAAPYIGSLVPGPGFSATSEAGRSAVAATYLAGADNAASALSALRGPELPGSASIPAPQDLPATTPPPAYLLAELPTAPDAESDATPGPGPGADEPVLTPDASITELSEAAASPADGLTVDVSAVQTAPEQPVAPAEAVTPAPSATEATLLPAAKSTAPAAASPDALHPASQPFDAPDLNFQIIQYARRAVPQALAQQPFGVIYAPAWPTWLAAQELRQRTGRPLVLHLAQLAATEDELIDLAAGWVAEIQRQALHRADLILTETPALAQRLRRELALPAHRVRAVPAADAAAVAQALAGVERE